MKATAGVVEKRFSIKENKTEGILNYDKDNAYPQRIANTIAASGTGSACVSRYKKHIAGRGFLDETFAKLKINRGRETNNDILKKIAWDFARFNGFALQFNFRIDGKIAEINHVNFELCRLCIPDDSGYISKIALYTDWDKCRSKTIRKDDIDRINIFNPDPEVVKKQITDSGGIEKYNGQILYFSTAGINTYPVAPCDPVLEDLETDAQISVYNWRTVKTGFIQQTAFIVKKEFENEEDRTDFREALKGFQGADNSNQILLVEASSPETVPEIKSIPVTINDKMFESMSKAVTEKIARNFTIPFALISVSQPGTLGVSKEFEEAENVYDNLTVDERTTITGELKKIFTYWKDTINTENILIIPKSGIKAESEKQPLAVALGVGGTQALQNILVDTTMSPDQKINVMILIFSIKPEEADALVKGTPLKT